MKKNKKMTATLLIFALLLLTSICSMSVFASEDDAADTETTETVAVSGCDLSSGELVKVEVKQYGFSMLAPDGNLTSIESPTENFTAVGYSRPYFMEQGCIMQTFTDNENYCAVSLFVEELDSIYNYYGDYSSLSKEQQEELVNDALSEGNESAEFVKINGRTYLESYVTDSSEDTGDVYAQYQFTTVINGQKYMLYIQTVNAIEADRTVINEMIKSIKLNGMSVALSTAEIVLIVVSIVLLLAVALAYFFLFRINEFTKAGVKEFAIVGFDLPAREEDDDDNDEDLDEDDDDLEEDDDAETEDDSEEADEVDEDSDDERIIKD